MTRKKKNISHKRPVWSSLYPDIPSEPVNGSSHLHHKSAQGMLWRMQKTETSSEMAICLWLGYHPKQNLRCPQPCGKVLQQRAGSLPPVAFPATSRLTIQEGISGRRCIGSKPGNLSVPPNHRRIPLHGIHGSFGYLHGSATHHSMYHYACYKTCHDRALDGPNQTTWPLVKHTPQYNCIVAELLQPQSFCSPSSLSVSHFCSVLQDGSLSGCVYPRECTTTRV